MGIFLPDLVLREGESEDCETVTIQVPKSFSSSSGIVVEINGPNHFNGLNETNAKTKIKSHCVNKIYDTDGSVKNHNIIISFDIPKYGGKFRDGVHNVIMDEHRDNIELAKEVEEAFD